MRIARILAIGILFGMATAVALAQTSGASGGTPADNAPQAENPSAKTDQPAAKPDEKKEEAEKGEEKKEGEKEEEKKEEPPPEPCRLIGNIGCSNLSVTGWIDMGGTIDPANPASHYNGTLAPNDRDEWQFDQTYLVMEKKLKTDNGCWDYGGRVDLLYGSDYIYCQSLGFETQPDGAPKWNASSQYGLAVPQAYIELGNDKLDCKIGEFYSIIGYESIMATNNFFYSMNYAVRYAEPTTNSGGLFSYKLNDDLTAYAGGVNGENQTDGVVNSLAVLTGFAYAPKNQKFSLNFGLMTGGLGPGYAEFSGPQTYFSLYGTYKFNDKWQSVTQWDSGWQDNYDGLNENHTAVYYSFTQYLFYTINPCWALCARYDMLVDQQGDVLGGLRPAIPCRCPREAPGRSTPSVWA